MNRAALFPVFLTLLIAHPGIFSSEAIAISAPVLVKERSGGADAGAGPCYLAPNRNGNCANYRWYNVCSGYIWVYSMETDEAVGVLFGGPTQPCVAPGNIVKRSITYFRNVNSCYSNVNVYLDRDNEGDGCPDGVLATNLNFDPGLRWNCSNFNVTIPAGVSHVIVRQSRTEIVYDCCDHGCRPEPCRPCPPPNENRFATDGPYSQICEPLGATRSFYYGVNTSACVPWVGPTGRHDNFLTWLIVDSGPTAVEKTSWGSIKGLYR